MKVDKVKAGMLLFAFLGHLFVQGTAAAQSEAGRAENKPPAQERQKNILLFTFIPPGSALFTEDDIQMNFAQASLPAAGQGLVLPALNDPRGYGRQPRPRSGWSVLENSLFAASLVSFVGLNIADFFTTRKILKELGPEDVNPVFRAFAKNENAFAVFKFGYTLMSLISLKSLHDSDKPMAWVISLLSNFLVSYALAYNLEQIENIR